ncbi:hypothetical protein [Anatilimnocola floriformis]|uniref:hypothetical protein n=1 Tax=Anatilimnocola floriformis TaxID=2948575 RepID=UPI0020C2F5F0|nr:hypothetical protein [Anatilimnocola floriformis]
MPKITRLRFASVGHPNARFGDLLLDFRDAEGRPVDSTLWLRNGGGKSSILNLFFAGVRPNRREFLGTSAETKRELREYVQASDHSVIAYEWELDGPRGQLAFEDYGERFITGTFYDWKGTDLKRWYFACRVTPEEPRLTIEGLPLYREENGKRAARLTSTSFRQEWHALQKQHPSRHVLITEHQGEWRDVLERAGIDPELFRYQVIMNHREGGADELFRFDTHEDFVDFLLELVLDPALADTVRDNLEKHRDDLRRCNHRLRPERDLLQGLLGHLSPMTAIAASRKYLQGVAGNCQSWLLFLSAHIRDRLSEWDQAATHFAEDSQRERQQAEEHGVAAKALRMRAAALTLFAANERLRLAAKEHEASQARHEQASRQAKIWQAAIPLKNALRFERNAAEYRAALQRLQTEHQPLMDLLTAAADRYAHALQASLDALRRQESGAAERIKEMQREARELRHSAGLCNANIARHDANIAHIETLLNEGSQRLQSLTAASVLLPNETGIDGKARLSNFLSRQQHAEAALEAALKEHRRQKDVLSSQKQEVALDHAAAVAEEQTAQAKLDAATAQRRELETEPLLCHILEVECADLEQTNDTTLSLVRHRAGSVMQQLVALRVSMQEDQRAVHYLSDGGLLPPTRDVERLLAIFYGRVRAWSGWLYLAENVTAPRPAVQAAPQTALGIVVADEDFTTACALAAESGIEFEMPLVLAPERSVQTNQLADCLVLGPHSDAWFDRSAGQQELLRRETQLEKTGSQISDAESDHKQVVDLDVRLRAFQQAYPRGWFPQQVLELDNLRSRVEAEKERQSGIQTQISDTERAITQKEGELTDLRRSLRELERHLQMVQQYIDQFEEKSLQRRLELEAAKLAIRAKRSEQKRCLEDAEAVEQKEGLEQSGLAAVRHDLSQSELLLSQIAYRSAAPRTHEPGPIQQLRDEYIRHKAQYEENVGEEGLLQLARENEENALPLRRKYSEHLGNLREEEVFAALQTLADPDHADLAYENAYQATFVVLNAVKTSKNAWEQAGEKQRTAFQVCRDMGASEILEEGDRPASLEIADQTIASTEASAQQQMELQQRSLSLAAAASQSQSDAEHSAEVMRSLRDQMRTIERSQGDVLARLVAAGAVLPTINALALADLEIRPELQRLDTTLAKLKEDDAEITARRQRIVKDVRQWVSDQRFDQLQSQVIRQFRSCDESQLEEHVQHFLEQLALRLKTIDEKLDEVSQNRNQLVSELQAIAGDGYSVLRSAANLSRLPDSVPELAGSQFLTISLNWPEDPAEQRGRLAELIDELVDEKQMPTGLKLIQSAVRRLARPVRVRVLNPDPNHKGQRLEIPEFAKFSGGERLTCAVLLYCTLAQLRAKRRGLHHKPSGVLLLDNPIGSASRVTFINLQLDVARAMGIQLIYTTGVNDYEALRPLPNLIRLRNDRVNRNNGQHIVELDSDTPVIQAARVARRDSSDDSSAAPEELHAQ